MVPCVVYGKAGINPEYMINGIHIGLHDPVGNSTYLILDEQTDCGCDLIRDNGNEGYRLSVRLSTAHDPCKL